MSNPVVNHMLNKAPNEMALIVNCLSTDGDEAALICHGYADGFRLSRTFPDADILAVAELARNEEPTNPMAGYARHTNGFLVDVILGAYTVMSEQL